MSTHLTSCSLPLLCSQGLLRGRKEKLLEQSFSLYTAAWIHLMSVKQKSPKHLSLSLSCSSASPPGSLELPIDTSKGNKNLPKRQTGGNSFAWIKPVILNIPNWKDTENQHTMLWAEWGPKISSSSNQWLLPLDQVAPSPIQPGLGHF